MSRFALVVLSIVLLFGCAQPGPQETGDGTMPTAPPAAPEAGPPPAEEEPEPAEPALPPAEAPPALKSEGITYKSLGWDIHGTLYESKNKEPTKVIMLLPMLDHTRSSYPASFIERLHDEVPDAMVLAIDMRGNGESTNLGTWEKFDSATFMDMKTDVLSVTPYFDTNHPTVENYYVVGASMGSTAAILAGAQDRHIVRIAMISPGVEYKGVNIERAVDEYRRSLLLVAASGDSYAASSASRIYELSRSQKILKTYSGSAHGTDLFDATEDESESLSDVLVDFLK